MAKYPMAQKELLSAAPFKIAENNLKYIGINLIKDVKELYDKNYKKF